MDGKYGNLPTLDAAKASLLDIEKSMAKEEWQYVLHDEWHTLPKGYDLNRLYMQIMGLQQVIIRNGGDLGFSKVPRIWFPRGHQEKVTIKDVTPRKEVKLLEQGS